MRVVITGRTGKREAEEARKRGHKIVGIARDMNKVTVREAEVVTGTPYDFETVRKAINGCDAVISTLSLFPRSQGLFGKFKTPLDSMSVSMKNTVKLMEEKGIKRKINSMISRNAVAHFMLDCIENGEFIRQKPGISNR